MRVLSLKFTDETLLIQTDEGSFMSTPKWGVLQQGVASLLPLDEETKPLTRRLLVPYDGNILPMKNVTTDAVVVCIARRYWDWANGDDSISQEIPDVLQARLEINSGKRGWPKPSPGIRSVAK